MAKLTQESRLHIYKELREGVPVKDIAQTHKVSRVLIYQLWSKLKAEEGIANNLPSAVSVLEREIATTESRVIELEKTVTEIERLKQEVKVKKSVLESLRNLEKK